MRELRSAGAFVRGWETLSHFFTMFRTASFRHIAISATIAAAVSGATMLAEMGSEKRLLGGYTRAAIYESFSPNSTVQIPLPDGTTPALGPSVVYQRYARHFGGRTYGFLWRQWALRLLLVFVVITPLLAWLMVTFGRKLSEARTLRGGQLIDTTTDDAAKSGAAQAMLVLLGAFVVGAVLIVLTRDGTLAPFRTAVGYTVAWLASASSPVAELLSPDWSGSTLWVATPKASGLLSPEDAVRFYRLELDQSLLGFVAMVTAAGAGAVFAARLALRQLGRRKTETSSTTRLIRIGSEELPAKLEPSGILITGSIGSGKSVAIKSIADTIRARGQRAIVNDIKGDLTALYYRPGHDILLNPLDERCAPWTPWAEIRDRSDYARLAKSLFPPMQGGNGCLRRSPNAYRNCAKSPRTRSWRTSSPRPASKRLRRSSKARWRPGTWSRRRAT